MNKDKLKGFLAGAICVSVLGMTAFAEPVTRQLNAAFDNIKIKINGEEIIPKDTAGNAVEPFIVDGTTYLPVRTVGEALGKDVSWDGTNKTVSIDDKTGSRPDDGEQEEIPAKTVTVSNAEELVDAIDSNVHIILKDGKYNLSAVKDKKTEFVNAKAYFKTCYDGEEFFLNGVQNLTIEGSGPERAEIIVEPRYANVLNLSGCKNITLQGVKLGHTPEEGYCTGGVLNASQSEQIILDNTLLFGCGTYGITAEQVKGLNVTDSIIEDCSNGIMVLESCTDVRFDACELRSCEASLGSLIDIHSCNSVKYENCMIYGNTGESMFTALDSENISVSNSRFYVNNLEKEFENERTNTKIAMENVKMN